MARKIAYLTYGQLVAAIIAGLILAVGVALVAAPHPVETPPVKVTPVPTPSPVYIEPTQVAPQETPQEDAVTLNLTNVTFTEILYSPFSVLSNFWVMSLIIIMMGMLYLGLSGGPSRFFGALSLIIFTYLGLIPVSVAIIAFPFVVVVPYMFDTMRRDSYR